MSNVTCANCGVEIVAGSRFCRRCGQPAPDGSRERSVLEAETRIFTAPPTAHATPTQHINSPLTGPAYMSPGQSQTPPAALTKPLEASGATTKWALIGLLLLLLIIPVAFAVVKMLKSGNSQTTPPVVTVPEIPPPPPPPPPPAARGGSSATNSPLRYPGSETVMELTGQEEGHVLQLRTSDPLDKVVQWYVEKVKPTSTVKTPGDNVTVLRSEGVNVVITGGGAQTEIIIRQGRD
jgi:zinc-ribbon domain